METFDQTSGNEPYPNLQFLDELWHNNPAIVSSNPSQPRHEAFFAFSGRKNTVLGTRSTPQTNFERATN